MAKNKIINLNDHLFAELERLGDENLKGEALKEEIKRSLAVGHIADRIINSGDLMLRARIAADNTVRGDNILPSILGADYGPDADTRQ
ncbi:hypothetical protein HMPREF0326_05685 [Desulfovibrio sp. 3_1_syn3]|uniref:hypothetical protein n=1 Tax=Desulfovibrio sp. 3_1_syn3 TaxID=457398 RepID=UPI0001E12EBE|nr:hypothetical protein [Desulfovibrio sp. 3_1_syn3]EFL84255.1 hypothetical protein HMPREF0326_03172 [Desulfovibrio sp. 3_1_syn3]EQN50824.1 hypothetical protein HMPREF0326_05685 [Desulfovibrio sp. 3_1_syn3]